MRAGVEYLPTFCLNCGKEAPQLIPAGKHNTMYYLCDDGCAEKWQREFDATLIPDEAFQALVIQEQLEREGRVLSASEQVEALKSSDHYLSVLARSRP